MAVQQYRHVFVDVGTSSGGWAVCPRCWCSWLRFIGDGHDGMVVGHAGCVYTVGWDLLVGGGDSDSGRGQLVVVRLIRWGFGGKEALWLCWNGRD